MTEAESTADVRRAAVGRRWKYASMLALVVGSAFSLLAATQSWFSVRLVDTADHVATISVAGSAAAPALTALALAGLALTAALAIAGPAFRIVLALLGVLLGVSVLISAGTALADPIRSSSAAVTTATGVAGDASIRRLVQSVVVEPWPWAAVAGGVVLVLGGASVIVFSRLWPGASRKYRTRFETEDGRPAAEALDASAVSAGGEEPQARPDDDAEARAVAEGESPREPGTLDRDTAIDSWDELSRGDDPTR
ncbi:Trp biosynthesis-associated membrane protein [Leifsonia sp. AG29]|uniref:Trp biosynthesis-associated membrane protein n=1 Tax=Leifsonia sp. AG29 TaxID=2598860 RepID=UPI001E3843AA|nr:Trp biosynthesis-associated membrane protein [Leifsonia sp. AG29]